MHFTHRTNGLIQIGEVAAAAVLAGGIHARAMASPAQIDLACERVNLAQITANWRLEEIEALTHGILSVLAEDQRLYIELDGDAVRTTARQAREALAAWVSDDVLRRCDRPPLHYGITFVTADNERAELEFLPQIPEHVVILVHGLDDPGWMWRDVIPHLIDAVHVVARLDYPNDGAIRDSADLLARELSHLRAAGVKSVDLVGKSMGGLVIRDVLTRADYYHGDGSGGDLFPAVDHFIMIGTPNHGSSLARLRGVLEIGEHLSRAWIGNGHGSSGRWPDGDADGCGEAAIDLLPGSEFLADLNSRPLATHTRHTIIAGRVVPVDGDQVKAIAERWGEASASPGAPQWLRRLAEEARIDRAADEITGALDAIGDGLVSLESARLEGVDDVVVVRADHVGLICNLIPSDAPPPAVPILLERLARPRPARLHDE